MESPLDVVILATAEGTGMRSRIPTVLHPLCGLPLLEHVLRAVSTLSPQRVIVVARAGAAQIKELFSDRGHTFVEHGGPPDFLSSLAAARKALTAPAFLTLPGEAPLVPAGALERLVAFHRRRDLLASFLSGKPNETGSGIACFSNVPELWDAIETASGEGGGLRALADRLSPGGRMDTLVWPEPDDLLRVEDRIDLARLEGMLRDRIATRLMREGVSIPDPRAVYLSPDVRVGADTILRPGTHLFGRTIVGEGCEIGPGSYLFDSRVEDGAVVWYSVLEAAHVEKGAKVGPFAHLRPGARIGPGARVGNFVEVKNARLGPGVKAGHLSYIGDAEVGARANIGAGTITCNYDGVKKNRTEIGPGAFIGSNSALVAPVVVGEGAYVGAGSVITEDVPPHALALTRAPQVIRPDWAKKREGGG